MRLTPRQVAVRAREAASLLLGTLEHDGHVGRFVRAYAIDYDRAGLLEQPALYRDLVSNIRREAVLAMAVHLDGAIAGRLGATAPGKKRARSQARGRKSGKRPLRASAADIRSREADGANVNVFREEFFVALGQAPNWREDDFSEFSRDFDLYQRIGARTDSTGEAGWRRTRAHRPSRGIADGPFVDRCGLLLDPSMLDQARRAAGRFQEQLHAITDQVLKRVFSARREN